MFKNIFKIFVLFLILSPLSSFAVESIELFDVTVKVNKDSSINVEEKITYNFDNNQKHGIYRDIPLKYTASYGNFSLYLSDISVVDDLGNKYTFTTSNIGKNKQIKIGDADKFITGTKTYIIKYKVDRAIGYFDGFDEIYWNVTGNEWIVPIKNVSTKIILPRSIKTEDIKISCYEGVLGSKENCSYSLTKDGAELVTGAIFSPGRARINSGYLAGEGMTVSVGFPKRVVVEPLWYQKLFLIIIDNLIFLLPILVFFIMLYIWNKKGRDPKGTGVIIAQYDVPNKLEPMEVFSILKGKIKNNIISVEIINLAVKGFLKISKKEKKHFWEKTDYKLTRTEKIDTSNLKKYEKYLLEAFFLDNLEIMLSSLQNRFFNILNKVESDVLESVFVEGYYEKNPAKAGNLYFAISIVMFFISIPAIEILGSSLSISFIISSVIIFVFGLFMKKKTEKGVETTEYILGFKEYLQIAEKDRINFHNAPERRPEIFEKFLPFAMVLGVERVWAKEFQDMYKTPPSWYQDTRMGDFSAVVFADNLKGFSSFANETLSSAPGSSSGSGGGGSSGGGGGGGGGGSW